MVAKGNTFYLPLNPAYDNHLWVVLTDPIPEEDGWILTVNISSVKSGFKFDPACILLAGEHRWLTKPQSYVRYGDAQLRDPNKFATAVKAKIVLMHDDVSPEIFKRIVAGAHKSEFFNLDWVRYL